MDYGRVLFIFLLFLIPIASAVDMGQIQLDTTFVTGSGNITILANQNFTNNKQLILFLDNNTLQFPINGSNILFNSTTTKSNSNLLFNSNVWNWTTSGTGTLNTTINVLYNLNYTLYLEGMAQYTNFTTNRQLSYSTSTAGNYSVQQTTTHNLISPANGSTNLNPSPVTFTWSDYPISDPNTIQVATDSTFFNIVSTTQVTSATGEYSAAISLSPYTTYYWRTKDNSGSYGYWWTFSTTNLTTIPGALNVTAKDEQTYATINNFTVNLYNSTTMLSKNTTTGWANFTSSEVSSGVYQVRIIPTSQSISSTTTISTTAQGGYVVNSSGGNTTYPNISSSSTSTTTTTTISTGYSSRSVLATSPTTVTVYLPASSDTNIVDLVAFYLLDYTNKFPFSNSYLTISANNSIMHSAYFDADAKVAAYLLRGNSYVVTVTNQASSAMQQWGNYVSTGSGNVEVVIMDIGVNSSIFAPFTSNITWNQQSVTTSWSDNNNVLTNLNYNIYKGNTSSTPVYSLSTTVKLGTTSYNFPSNDTYYVIFSALTSNGYKNYSQVIDLNAGKIGYPNRPIAWVYGAFVVPAWLQLGVSILFLMLSAGTFGALHRSEGAIITGILSLLFYYWGWLGITPTLAGFLGSIVLFIVLYHLESKRRQNVVY